MTRWIVSFVVVLVLFGILYYLVRLRPIPEDDIKQRAHDEGASGRVIRAPLDRARLR